MHRRIVSLWLPHLAVERLLRSDATIDSTRPFAVVAMSKSALRLCSINPAGVAAGLKLGSTLTDMRAICPDLHSIEHQPQRDAAFLRALARWGLHYTPWTALDSDDGLLLDITGGAHLFGGEESMLEQMSARLADMGLTVHAGLADTRGAAWALARFSYRTRIAPEGYAREAVLPLPISALRIAEETVTALNRLGLRTIGDIAGMPRGALARRFGTMTLRRLDQIMGVEPEPLTPAALRSPYAVRLSLPEPIGKTGDVMAALERLLERLCGQLEKDQRGARQMRLSIQRSDHSEETAQIGLGRPSHDPTRIARLFERAVDGMDAGFGIDAVRLHAVVTEPLVPEQSTVHSREAQDRDSLSDLIARLGNRIGFDRVTRFLPADSHIPERAFITAAAAYSEPEAMRGRGHARPIILFAPEPVSPDDGGRPPILFRWRGTVFETQHARGPERIAPEWWWDDPAWRSGVRDYWRIQTVQGQRLWLFQVKGREESDVWFAHGEFA